YFVAILVLLFLVTGMGLYALAVTAGRSPLSQFARAVCPAQAVAFPSRSSAAALPLMVEAARDQLRLRPDVAGFVIPLAVSVFKPTSPISWTLGALFVGKLYGIDLTATQLMSVGAASIALNAATPPIPSGGLLIQAPVFASIGLPVEGLGILIAIDAIPDMFKTVFNVTADMAVAAVLSGREPVTTAPA
ncbi:MAG: cation:dicarboxylase symporter family transporter, partial [Gemmatimonadetes bacterium]|nr:cation:dicarboxylase symporter family transporter [Gemmatimonadota bacterium]